MLYTVKHGDTLYRISKRFGSSIQSILNSNVICDPDVIYVGDILIIPRQELNQPRAGGRPYYIVRPGDTLYRISQEFNTPVNVLISINQLPNDELILYGSEILIVPDQIPDPSSLMALWEHWGDTPLNKITDRTVYDQFYMGTFQWAALGRLAIPYLLNLLNSQNRMIRFYTVTALGRIGIDHEVKLALEKMLSDKDQSVALEADIALTRIKLVEQYGKRIHVLETSQNLIGDLNTNSPVKVLPVRTAVTILRWHVPSPRGEYGPTGEIQIYDYIQVIDTGEKGFLPRSGYQQISLL